MAKRKIIWTRKANLERKEILEYWIDRNKSLRYSKKLNALFLESINRIRHFPNSGRKTDDNNTRIVLVRNYLLFYEFNDHEIIIQSVWDGKRDQH